MQEHPQYKATPEQGWSQMHTVLDKEMPVQPQSRRFAVFWWSGAAVAAIGLMLVLQALKSRPVAQPSVSAHSVEIASSEKNSSTPKDQIQPSHSTSNEINNAASVTGDISNNSIGSHKKSIASTHPLLHQGDISQNSNYKKNSKKQSNGMDNTQSAIEAETNSPFNSANNNTNTQVNENSLLFTQPLTLDEASIVSKNDQVSDRTTSATSFLPYINAMDYTYTQDDIGAIDHGPYTSTVRKRPTLTPNLFAGFMVGTQSSLGTNVGIGADYGLSSRLSLTGSLGYMSYHPHAFNLGHTNEDVLLADSNGIIRTDTSYTGINNYIVGEKVNTTNDYAAVNSLIHSIRQWKVSVGLKDGLSGRFFIEGGVALGFGTTAKSELPIITGGTYAPLADGHTASTFDSYDIIRSTMISLYGGLGYNITRQFNVHAQWSQGLNHYLLIDQANTSAKRTDYIRGLILGVMYHL